MLDNIVELFCDLIDSHILNLYIFTDRQVGRNFFVFTDEQQAVLPGLLCYIQIWPIYRLILRKSLLALSLLSTLSLSFLFKIL